MELAPFVNVGEPGFPAYFFGTVRLALNGEPFVPAGLPALPELPGVIVAPKDVLGGGIGDGLQFAKTFEPVCPVVLVKLLNPGGGLVTNGWRLSAKATPPERASRQTPIAREDMCFFMLCTP